MATAKKKKGLVIPKVTDLVLPKDPMDPRSNDKLLTSGYFKISNSAKNTMSVYSTQTRESEPLAQPVRVIILFASTVVSCTADRGKNNQICYGYNIAGYSQMGHYCPTCPYDGDSSVKRSKKRASYLLVENEGKMELLTFKQSNYTAGKYAAALGQIRDAIYRDTGMASISYALLNLKSTPVPADWDPTVKLALIDSQKTTIERVLTDEEIVEVTALIAGLREFDEKLITDRMKSAEARAKQHQVAAPPVEQPPIGTPEVEVTEPEVTESEGPEDETAPGLAGDDDENLPF